MKTSDLFCVALLGAILSGAVMTLYYQSTRQATCEALGGVYVRSFWSYVCIEGARVVEP